MGRFEVRRHAGSRTVGLRRVTAIALLLTVCLLANAASAYAASPAFTHVYRFYNKRTGAHLYTTDIAEYQSLVGNRSFTGEGTAYSMWAAFCTTPLHRFYNMKKGVHFYTADAAEAENMKVTMAGTYRYEGVAYNVGTFGIPIHRFLNLRNGVHFYSADAAEVENVKVTMTATYRYEGIAFYAPQYIDIPTP